MNKTLADLTELEMLKLQIAQEHLKHCAALYAIQPADSMNSSMLYSAAREFDATCREIGFTDYWRQEWVTPSCCND